MLRVALACCQVASPTATQKDRFARLITKSNFDNLKGTKVRAGIGKVALPFGKFQVMLTLWLLDKELKGREEKKYETMEKSRDCLKMIWQLALHSKHFLLLLHKQLRL